MDPKEEDWRRHWQTFFAPGLGSGVVTTCLHHTFTFQFKVKVAKVKVVKVKAVRVKVVQVKVVKVKF